MDMYLELCGLKVKIKGYPYNNIPEAFRPFCSKFSDDTTDVLYSVCLCEKMPEIKGKSILKTRNHEVFQDGNVYTKVSELSKMTYYTVFKNKSNAIGKKKKIIKLYMHPRFLECYDVIFSSSLMFDYVITDFHRILMHASVVKYESDAILFTGHSGIGKSTQANLWEQFKGADIINGDRAVLYPEENDVIVYGSPYAGSSGIYRNEQARVKAIVLLDWSDKNSIRRIKGVEAYKMLFPRFSFLRWNKDVFLECEGIVNEIIDKVPVYVLSCYPGEEVVDLLYKTIYNID